MSSLALMPILWLASMPIVNAPIASASFLANLPIMDAKEFLALVERRLDEKGLKAAAASKLAVGNPYLIRNMQKSLNDADRQSARMPSFEHLQSLCRVLDLEFYVGPPRYDGAFKYDGSIDYSGAPVVQAAPLPAKLCARLRLPVGATEAQALAALDALAADFAAVAAALARMRRILDGDDGPAGG